MIERIIRYVPTCEAVVKRSLGFSLRRIVGLLNRKVLNYVGLLAITCYHLVNLQLAKYISVDNKSRTAS